MIRLSNKHCFEYMVASGALGFDGLGWWWERPFVAMGLMKPELFTVVLKSLTLEPTKGNLRWSQPWTWLPWSPWSCVRFIPGGAVNKVGLTNPGIGYWAKWIGPHLNYEKYALVGSIFGNITELFEMAQIMDRFNFKALEVNVSCPNTGHALEEANEIIDSVKLVDAVSRHPIIVKVSATQDYLTIARGLRDTAEAVSFNTVPWNKISDERSPLWRLEKKLKERNPKENLNGGGVSGAPARQRNWVAVKALADTGYLPVIAPSVMEYDDIAYLRRIGAKAESFGTIHMRKPWLATQIVERDMSAPIPIPVRQL